MSICSFPKTKVSKHFEPFAWPSFKFTYNIKINISHGHVKLLYGMRISLLNHTVVFQVSGCDDCPKCPAFSYADN